MVEYIVTDGRQYLSYMDKNWCLSTEIENVEKFINFEIAVSMWKYVNSNHPDFRIINNSNGKDFTPPLIDVKTDKTFHY